MKKTLLFLFFLPALALSQPQTCAVTGTFYGFDGELADSLDVTVVRVYDSSGAIIASVPKKYKTGGSKSGALRGVVQFNILRNSVAYIAARAMNWDSYGSAGRRIAIPDAASGVLSSFVAADSVPSSHIVVIPVLTVTDSSTGTSYRTDSLRFGAGLTVDPPAITGGVPTLRATATGGGDTTGTTNRPEITNIESDIQKHADSLTVHRGRLDLAEIEIDTKQNQLTAAQLVRLDSVLAGGYRISVTSAGNIKIITFDSTGMFALYGGVMVESDPTATAKAQIVAGDSLKKFPYGLNTPGTLGYVWKTLAGGAQGWRPDSAGGASVDTAKLVSMDRDDAIKGEKTFSGTTRFAGVVEIDANLGRLQLLGSRVRLEAWSGSYGLLLGTQGAQPIDFMYSGGVVGGFQANGLRLGDNVAARKRLDVNGGIIGTDTLRIGDYTTYSYFIPGGALVQSSTQEIKRNIAFIDPPSGVFAKFLSVKPRRYQFKPEAYRTLTLANVSDTLSNAERLRVVREDSLRAEQLAKRWQIGLLAEEFNQNIFNRTSREIDQAEVTTALWLVLQEAIKEAAALKQRIEALETQAAKVEARLKALGGK